MNLDLVNFEAEVLDSDIPVLVDFWGSWCPPCKMMEPLLADIEKEYAGKVKVGKLNIDKVPDIASRYVISGVPTFAIFVGGEEQERLVGAQSKDRLKWLIDKYLE